MGPTTRETRGDLTSVIRSMWSWPFEQGCEVKTDYTITHYLPRIPKWYNLKAPLMRSGEWCKESHLQKMEPQGDPL
jgi:hypothetical protein